MADDQDDQDEPTQRTEKGLEIPIPKRDEVITNFKKAAQPKAGSRWAKKPPARPAAPRSRGRGKRH